MQEFSKEFWQKFIKSNSDFSEACVLKNAINKNILDELNLGVMEVLRNRLIMQDMENGFRVYLEGKQQDGDFLKQLCQTPPLDSENIVSYTDRIFKEKFAFIINSGERHSDYISSNILRAVKPLIDLKGIPPLGFEVTIFIGNYGWTPLGIHQDHPGENVIHFHLGPGRKKMFIWDEDKYRELTNLKFNNTDIEPILSCANEYAFDTSDLFYMPWNKFHVGLTEDLSVGITFWFNNPSKYKYTQKIFEFFDTQYIRKDREIIENKFELLMNVQNSAKDFFDILDINDEILNGTFTDFINFICEDFNYNLVSNGGWQSLPLSMSLKTGFDVDKDYIVFENAKVKSNSLFGILCIKRKENLIVYVRGSKFQMKYFLELVILIDLLNQGKVVVVNSFLNTEGSNIPREAILYFLALLYDKRGLELIN